jgi:hypothetical protein
MTNKINAALFMGPPSKVELPQYENVGRITCQHAATDSGNAGRLILSISALGGQIGDRLRRCNPFAGAEEQQPTRQSKARSEAARLRGWQLVIRKSAQDRSPQKLQVGYGIGE